MKKNFIVKFMAAILLFAMSFTYVFAGDRAIEVEAAGKEQTSEYVFSNADYKAATNKVGVINSYQFDGGFEIQVLNKSKTPILGYTSGRGITFKSGTFVTIKASTKNNTLISFSVLRAESDPIAGTIDNGVISKNNVKLDDGKSLTLYTPIDGTKEMEIEFEIEERFIYSFSITYSLPHTHDYTVLKYDEVSHWKECSCGNIEFLEEHNLVNEELIITEKASVESVTRTSCDGCGYAEDESTYNNFDVVDKIDVNVDDLTNHYFTDGSLSDWATEPNDIITLNEPERYKVNNLGLYQYLGESVKSCDFTEKLEYGYSYKLMFELEIVVWHSSCVFLC